MDHDSKYRINEYDELILFVEKLIEDVMSIFGSEKKVHIDNMDLRGCRKILEDLI
jgi:hypothetical protein